MSALEPYIGAAKAAAVIGVLLGAVWIGHHYGAQGVQVQWDAEKLKQAEIDRERERAARAKEADYNRQVQEARNGATKREQALRADAAAARDAADGLRDDLREFQRQLPGLADDAVRQRAAALANVLEQCEIHYRGVAEAADHHASDVRTLTDAWPK